MKDKIVKFIEVHVVAWPCNFRCNYCFIGHKLPENERGVVSEYKYTPQEFASMLSKKRLGGTAIINFGAYGETLILPKNLEYIKALLNEGHFVMIVSNMTITKSIDALMELPQEQRERLFFKGSYHYMELKKRGLLQTFADNMNKIWKAGCSGTVELVPCDEMEEYIDELSQFSLDNFGALPHVTIARDELKPGYTLLTKHSLEDYKKIWSQFKSELFEMKMQIWEKKITQFCYAGDWAFQVELNNGKITRCNGVGEIGQITDKKLPRKPACKKCPLMHCYNGHSYIASGVVPDIKTMTSADIRDRVRPDGTHWLTPRYQHVFSQKLYENNKRYSPIKEKILNFFKK